MIMTITQLAALVLGMLAILVGAAVKIITLLIRIVTIFQDQKRTLTSHEERLVHVESATAALALKTAPTTPGV